MKKERNPQGFGGAVHALVLKATPSQDLKRSTLSPGVLDWALVLPLLSDVQMEPLFQEHQPSMRSTLAKGF